MKGRIVNLQAGFPKVNNNLKSFVVDEKEVWNNYQESDYFHISQVSYWKLNMPQTVTC